MPRFRGRRCPALRRGPSGSANKLLKYAWRACSACCVGFGRLYHQTDDPASHPFRQPESDGRISNCRGSVRGESEQFYNPAAVREPAQCPRWGQKRKGSSRASPRSAERYPQPTPAGVSHRASRRPVNGLPAVFEGKIRFRSELPHICAAVTRTSLYLHPSNRRRSCAA